MNKSAALNSIPYFDLTRQYARFEKQYLEALTATAASGRYVLGSAVEQFEDAFAKYCGAPYAVGVGSGTDALIFALHGLGIQKGDEVIVPSFTFCASVFAIVHVGAKPVYAEVDLKTYTLDPKSVEKALTSKTRASLPVHLYGQPADMDALHAIAKKRKLKIVEDACQAHGAEWKGKKTGSLGDVGCFSFYPTKNLGAMGDGGMIVTSNKALVERVKKLRNLGRSVLTAPHTEVGWTSRLDAMQASILNIKLKHLDDFNDNRRRVAKSYFKRLHGTPLVLPLEAEDRKHVYHLFVVRVPNGKRDALKNKLAEEGIHSMIHYPIPVHRQPACKPFFRKSNDLRGTEKISKEILSLPMFPEMTEEEVSRVSEVVHRFYGNRTS
jgi:dTDP-4-amino-4,6-dideoxygalactose transaminase